MKKILVFFGGKSVEHDVSVITGVLTLNSLDRNLFEPIPVYVDRKGNFLYGNELFDIGYYKKNNFKKLKKVTLLSGDNNLYLVSKNKIKKLFPISCAISCLHGLNGEDGSVIGLIKMAG
ncbi:MAG: D-alanine--D-alanine ligase, partial [Clostridia bacterium]|nr:D-alanine--D-alanine ligase [Clostridia bacterium]